MILHCVLTVKKIDSTDQTRFLGVIIDKKLDWRKHISLISGKVSRGLGIISKARKYLPRDAIMSLYYSFIYPYLTYCNLVWGTACATHLKKTEETTKKSNKNYRRCKTTGQY